MSNTAELIDFIFFTRLGEWLDTACVGLTWYEYALTFDQEVRCMWKSKFSWVSVLFYMNRYSVLLATVDFLLMHNWLPEQSGGNVMRCDVYVRVAAVLNIISGICAAVFYATRTFALYSRNYVIFFLTLFLGLIGPVVNIYTWALMIPVVSDSRPVLGAMCGFTFDLDISTYESYLMGVRASALAADTVILVLTFYEAYRLLRYCGALKASTIMKVMVQQGAVYFLILGAINIVGIVTGRIESFLSTMPTVAATLTSILISRFILELRDECINGTIQLSVATVNPQSVLFARVSGTMDPMAITGLTHLGSPDEY